MTNFQKTIDLVFNPISLSRAVFFVKGNCAFFLFGLFSFFYSGLIPLVFVLTLGNRKLFQRINRAACRLGFSMTLVYSRFFRVIDIRFIKHAPIPKGLVIANHISLYDVVSIIAKIPNCHTFVKAKYLKNGAMAGMIAGAGFVPVDPTNPSQRASAYERVKTIIQNGGTFLIFPEGSRSRDGNLGDFHRGVFRMAYELGVDINPIFVTIDLPVLNNTEVYSPFIPCATYRAHIHEKIKRPETDDVRKGSIEYSKITRKKYQHWLKGDDCLKWNKGKLGNVVS